MKIPQRLSALLTAAALLLHAAAFPVPGTAPANTAEPSALAEQLRSRTQTSAPFSTLCFDGASGRLLRDGSDTGTEFAGFSAENGELRVQRAAVLTQAELDSGADTTGTVSPAEAAERIGCVFTETAHGTEIRSPFQTCTLIVRADGAPDPHGGTEKTDSINGLRVFSYPTPADTYAAYHAFTADSSITFAEPELIYHINTEGDPHTDPKELEDGEWGYDAVGCDAFKTRLDTEQNEADPICVAVLDTGIYAEHEWFRGRIAEGACSFVEGTGTDDDNCHGTHCAGIIARSTRDNVSILPLKVLDETGYGSSLQIYFAMLYAAEQGADIVSMSLGCDGLSLLLQDAARRLHEKGIPCIAAAGNDERDVKYENPANIGDVIAVSAVSDSHMTNEYKFSEFLVSILPEVPQNRYQLAAFSNFGDNIDFAAPGVRITSAYLYEPDALAADSGTSMAAPFVTACYANLMDYDKSLTQERIYELLKLNAIDLGEPGFDSAFGWGMVTLSDLIFTEADCPRPTIQPECDKFATEVFDAEITAPSPDAEIYYTTDGSTPSRTNGTCYDGTPVRITHATVLKAVCLYGGRSSAVETKTYLFNVSMPFTDATPGHYYEKIDEMKLYGPEHSKIYYTLDGSVPDPETSLCYHGETISIEKTAVLSAIAVIGEEQSMVFRAVYEIGGKNRENLLILNGTVLEACYADDRELDLKALAGDRIITEIAPFAFESNDILKQVTLPDSVRIIGESAFANCHALESITGKGVTEIGDEAFHDCPRLTAFRFGAVTEYGKKCFRKCSKLTLGTPDLSKVRSIGAYAFAETKCSGTFNLPSLESLGAYAFMQTGDLELILPDTLTALPDGLCLKAASLKLTAEGVTQIGASALETEAGKSAVKELKLPWASLTTVGAHAFSHADLNDAAGGQIVFSALTNIGQGAFQAAACRGMSFPELKILPKDAFSGVKAEVLRFDAAESARADSLIPKEGHP
ncbi:MAG: S8 family serine peptidase, partial [Oscillospiraceae bacterium]|nr:S8 family serine peptidase [Oscillospiraceae bacterium]